MSHSLVRFSSRIKSPRPMPINPNWIESGAPEANAVILAQSDDKTATTVLWNCSAGVFTWRYDVDETAHILEGEVTIRVRGKPDQMAGTGDTLHFARGAVATWIVKSHVRKIAFCRNAPPRAFGLVLGKLRDLKRNINSFLKLYFKFILNKKYVV